VSDGPVPIDVGQLLLIDPNAYVNLILQFPDASVDPNNPPKKIEDIQAYVLPANFKLLLVAPHEAVLVSRNPPGIFAYDKKDFAWKPVNVVAKKA
jgi:hypothetical protein